ncbi:MAG: polyprenyl synthetase family protein [Bacteroidaceae bacterium]|nr:polyprenyl synthetase family protein [Bacteroidaceae bacterium]
MNQKISEYVDIINNALDNIEYPQQPDSLYAPIRYELTLGGKRIRPVLMLMACELFGGDINQAIKPAVGLEIFHNFTLLHDDVMDKSDLRRGQPTVHKMWDENHAILSGDAMQIIATQHMTQVAPRFMPAVIETFLKTALEICEGQQFDMEFESRKDVTTDEYINMIRLKTAVLLGCALKIGAIIAGAPIAQANSLYHFGENLGLAFQLQDDYLDVYGDPIIFGKNIGGDITNDKKTFMLIEAMRLAEGKDADTLKQYIGNNDAEPREKIDAVINVYNNLGIDKLCKEKAETYYNAALTCMDEILVPEDRKLPLLALAKSLMNRDH